MSVFFSKKTQQGVYAAEEVKEKTQTESKQKACMGMKWKFLLNQVNPKNAMRSFGTFVSKIDWSKSDSLREQFRPFEHLGTEKIYAL